MTSTRLRVTLASVCLLACMLGCVEGQIGSAVKRPDVERVRLLKAQTQQQGVLVQTNTQTYLGFVTPEQRSYASVLFFTANRAERGCQMCRQLRPIVSLMAHHFSTVAHEHNKPIYFFEVDVDAAREVFGFHNMNRVPQLVYVPAGRSAPWPQGVRSFPFPASMTFSMQGVRDFQGSLVRWMAEKHGMDLRDTATAMNRNMRGSSYDLTTGLMYFVGLVGAVVFMWRAVVALANLRATLRNPLFWTAVSFLVFFWMMSGVVWNAIRGAMFSYRNPYDGSVMYISPHHGHQFAAEGMIIAGLMLGAGISVILMEAVVPKVPYRGLRLVVLLLLMLGFYLCFANVNWIYQRKNRGYPFAPELRWFVHFLGRLANPPFGVRWIWTSFWS